MTAARVCAAMVSRALVAAMVVAVFAPGGIHAGQELAVLPSAGDPDATLEIHLFTSLTCEPCSRAAIIVEGLLAARPKGVRVVFRHLPAKADPDAWLAHRALVAARGQGRFWEMQSLMFANRDRLSRPFLVGMAAALGLDVARFTADLDNAALDASIDADIREAERRAIVSAPTFVFPSGRTVGFLSRQQLINVVDAER